MSSTQQFNPEVRVDELAIRMENIKRIPKEKNNLKISSVIQFTKQEVIFEELRTCYEILVDKQGALWALGYSGRLLIKFNWKVNNATLYSFGTEMSGPLGLAFSPFGDDNILVSCQDSKNVLVFDKKTEALSTINGMTNVGHLRGMTFDSKHNLYITDYVPYPAKALHKFDCSDGLDNVKKLETTHLSKHGRVCTVRVNPSNDDLYVSFYDQSVICKIVNAQVVKEYTEVSTVDGAKQLISEANGLCIYHDHLLIADRKNDTILVVDLKNNTVETLDIHLYEVNTIVVDPFTNIMYAANETTIWRLTFDSMLGKHAIFNQVPQKTTHSDIVITMQS